MIFGAVLHVTVFATLAFFVLFAASKSDGFVALLGRLLGYWFLLLAILGLVMAVMFHLSGGKPFGIDMTKEHPGWMHHWDREAPPPEPNATPATPPAKDVTPPPAAKKG